MQDIPNPSGMYTPVKVLEGGYVPVMRYKDLLQMPRSVLNVYLHGVSPYNAKRAHRYLFISNTLQNEMFVLHDRCKLMHESLLDDKVKYFEKGPECFVKCSKCLCRDNTKLTPLHSTVDWKLVSITGNDEDNDDDGEKMVCVKLDAANVYNHEPEMNAKGECTLDRFLQFFCSNHFRSRFPKTPKTVEDLWVLGHHSRLPDWNSSDAATVT